MNCIWNKASTSPSLSSPLLYPPFLLSVYHLSPSPPIFTSFYFLLTPPFANPSYHSISPLPLLLHPVHLELSFSSSILLSLDFLLFSVSLPSLPSEPAFLFLSSSSSRNPPLPPPPSSSSSSSPSSSSSSPHSEQPPLHQHLWHTLNPSLLSSVWSIISKPKSCTTIIHYTSMISQLNHIASHGRCSGKRVRSPPGSWHTALSRPFLRLCRAFKEQPRVETQTAEIAPPLVRKRRSLQILPSDLVKSCDVTLF